MIPRVTARRSILLAGTIAGLLLAAPVFAQQPPASAPPAAAPAAAPALPPGSPLIGRPEGNEAAGKLAPVAPPPIPAAADKLPTAKLKLPPGFNIEVYASGIANTRSLRIGDKGTVFVGTRFGNKVTAIVKKDGKTEIKTIAEGLYRPNGLAYHNGTLYIAELSQISKIDNVEANLDKPPKPTVIYKDLPKDEAHGWKFIAIGPDNKLYIPVGQPGNNVMHAADAWPDPPHQSRRHRHGSGRARRAQHGRLRLESGEQAALLLRQRPRLDVGGRSAGRAQPHHQDRRAFRLALLLPGQSAGSGIRLGPQRAASSPRRSC